MSGNDRPDRVFLVGVGVGMGDLGEVGVQQVGGDEVGDRGSGGKDLAEAEVGPLEQGGVAGVVEAEQLGQLRGEVGVAEGVGGDLIFEEVADDFFGVDDGIEHGGSKL